MLNAGLVEETDERPDPELDDERRRYYKLSGFGARVLDAEVARNPMIQLFRDRMRRDGGGLRTLIVWAQVGFDLVASAFKERMETIMAIENWTNRWWEASVVLLAVNSVVFGFLFTYNDHLLWAIAAGFGAGALLLGGLALRTSQRLVATVMLTLGSVGAALAFWVIYTVVLALVIVVGGFGSGKIGPDPAQPEVAI